MEEELKLPMDLDDQEHRRGEGNSAKCRNSHSESEVPRGMAEEEETESRWDAWKSCRQYYL